MEAYGTIVTFLHLVTQIKLKQITDKPAEIQT